MRRLALALLMLLPMAATAGQTVIVEVTGAAIQSGAEDASSARRRALADAAYAAALAGGAEVSGHTAMMNSVITSDVAIVRPVGRVLGIKILSETRVGDEWRVTISAKIGVSQADGCLARQTLLVTVYPADIRVSPQAPAWTAQMAQTVVNDLLEQLADNPQVKLQRVSDRPLPKAGSAAGDANDYTVLTRGSNRLGEGEYAYIPSLRIGMEPTATGSAIHMEVRLHLVGYLGNQFDAVFARDVAVPSNVIFGSLTPLVTKDRLHMTGKLTKGLKAQMDAFLTQASCAPVVARLAVASGVISVPVGRANGLTAGSIAFTADADASTQLLEVVDLANRSASLRPLDPTVSVTSFAGRPVRFVQTDGTGS